MAMTHKALLPQEYSVELWEVLFVFGNDNRLKIAVSDRTEGRRSAVGKGYVTDDAARKSNKKISRISRKMHVTMSAESGVCRLYAMAKSTEAVQTREKLTEKRMRLQDATRLIEHTDVMNRVYAINFLRELVNEILYQGKHVETFCGKDEQKIDHLIDNCTELERLLANM